MDKIAIVGVGQTRYERRKKSERFSDLVYEVTQKALEDAGLTPADVGNVVSASNDFWDGRTISSMAIQDACGSRHKDISTVEGDGLFGALYGTMRIMSGSFPTTLVVAHMKGSESRMNLITNAIFDPIYSRSLGLDSVTSSALQARAYMDAFGITEKQCAKVSVKNHGNAKNNPLAQLPLDISVDDVMNSKMISDPIKLLDASPVTDGAAAIILANEESAKKAKTKPVWIKGVGHCSDAYHLGDRDLARSPALIQAAKKAYSMAGVSDPLKDLDVIELYDAFSYMELLWLEGLGVCQEGGAGKLMDSGVTSMGGDLPVNPSGGCLSAHPVIVAGLVRLIEAALQVRGDAGDRQVQNCGTALAHGINGACGQGHCVMVVGG
ncbi:MAG: thiolase family protein [Thermodesulfobacteriota bacterium]|nr:thiolase family protein [Thermodesulfobacteriota bacterium]